MSDIVTKLDDLLVQATKERTHYYVASCARDARAEIERLRKRIAELEDPHYLKGRDAEIERLRADKEYLRALLRKAANEIDELGFPSKADEFLSALITLAKVSK